MKRILHSLLLGMACSAMTVAGEPLDSELEQQARQLVQQFIGKLQPQLQQAMASGGPTHAIEVCASTAPKIADGLSQSSGWQIKRVSLKARNATRAQPDAWERQVLEQFDARQAAAEKAPGIHYAQRTGQAYRYMQAQGVGPLCLTCHGDDLPPAVSDTLREYYPDDMATGYSLGQVRGAISLSRELGHL